MINGTLTNAILSRGAFELSDHSGTFRDEFDYKGFHFLIEVPYTITYTRDSHSYYYGPQSQAEVMDSDYDIELYISLDGEDITEHLHARTYDNLINTIDNKILVS